MLDISEEWIKKGGRNYGWRDKLSNNGRLAVWTIYNKEWILCQTCNKLLDVLIRMTWSKVAKHHSGCE